MLFFNTDSETAGLEIEELIIESGGKGRITSIEDNGKKVKRMALEAEIEQKDKGVFKKL